MSSDDTEYFRQRAVTEREMEKTAPDPMVAQIHRQLAEEYEALVAQPELRPKLRIAF